VFNKHQLFFRCFSRKTANVAEINNKGVEDLFSDILFPQHDEDQLGMEAEAAYQLNIAKLLEESSRILQHPPPAPQNKVNTRFWVK
jgi:hypothetical protein